MKSTALLLFLIGSFVVQIYSDVCPNRVFVSKHVCQHCHDVKTVEKFAINVEKTTARSELTTAQTIYAIARILERDWSDTQFACATKTPVDKYFCRKLWICVHKGSDKARHRKSNVCPDINLVNLCADCKKPNAREESRAVSQRAVKTERDLYAQAKRQRKEYQPISNQIIYVLNDISETRNSFWTVPASDRSMCEMTEARAKYECTAEWKCEKKGTGNAKHRKDDGHLIEN